MSSPNPIGGGGGQGGSAAANAFALGLASPIDNQSYVGTIDFTLGGTGGSGGTAGAVTANVNAGTSITTQGPGITQRPGAVERWRGRRRRRLIGDGSSGTIVPTVTTYCPTSHCRC